MIVNEGVSLLVHVRQPLGWSLNISLWLCVFQCKCGKHWKKSGRSTRERWVKCVATTRACVAASRDFLVCCSVTYYTRIAVSRHVLHVWFSVTCSFVCVCVLASRDRAGGGGDRRARPAGDDGAVSGRRRRRRHLDGHQRLERQRYVAAAWRYVRRFFLCVIVIVICWIDWSLLMSMKVSWRQNGDGWFCFSSIFLILVKAYLADILHFLIKISCPGLIDLLIFLMIWFTLIISHFHISWRRDILVFWARGGGISVKDILKKEVAGTEILTTAFVFQCRCQCV